MDILLSNTGGQPIYEQVASQIKNQIISGALQPGEMLPSIRSLAKDLKISVITTKRAYDELEAAGFLHRGRQGLLCGPEEHGADSGGAPEGD